MPPHAASKPQESDSALACLLMLARFYGVPANPEPLQHQFVPSGKIFGETELLLAAKHLGFKAGATVSDWSRLTHTALPAIAQQQDGRYVVIARADGEKVLVQDPAEPRPLLLPRDVFEQAWSGRLILLTKRANLRPEDRKFDFTWFFPAIAKHRKLSLLCATPRTPCLCGE